MDALHADLPFALASPRDVIGGLHPHERVHLHAKGLFNTQGHIPGKIRLAAVRMPFVKVIDPCVPPPVRAAVTIVAVMPDAVTAAAAASA
jgi:hypothetical protein